MPSEIDGSTQARSDLPEAVVRAQLERILASEVFSRSRHLRRFLSFIVEQDLAGHGHSLKTIATSAARRCRLRLVGLRRAGSDGHLSEGRRE